MKEWYGDGDVQKFPDLPRIVNKRHFQRIKKLLDSTKGTIVYGGKSDEADLWIEPTVVGKQPLLCKLHCVMYFEITCHLYEFAFL